MLGLHAALRRRLPLHGLDPEKRLQAHNAGKGAKYTRSRLPVALVYRERCADRSEAMRRENELKRLSRAQKLALIEGRVLADEDEA